LPERAIVEAWRDAERVDTATAMTAVPVLRRVESLAAAIEEVLGRPIDVQSWGPTAGAKRAADTMRPQQV
jgi:hypothetical protein